MVNASGGHRAYLHARANASPEELSEVQNRLQGMGYKTVPSSENDIPMLEVRGFKHGPELFNYLSSHAWTQGTPQVIMQRGDVVSPKERRRNSTLKFTGFAYNVGDAAYMTYTIRDYLHDKKSVETLIKAGAKTEEITAAREVLSGSKLGIGGGIGYALGGIALSFFAGKDQSQNEIKSGVRKARNFIIHEGADVPVDTASYHITQKEDKPLGTRISDFLKKNPSETLNTIYTGVGILLAVSSLKKVNALKVKDVSLFAKVNEHALNEAKDVGLGAITMTSSLIGLLVKEKKPEPDEAKETGLRRAWQWIQEKPLRATGVGLGISTLFHGWATIGKYKSGDAGVRSTVMFRAAFVAANILAETLIFLSSKGHGEGVIADQSVEDSVLSCTAEMISKQPVKTQSQLIHQLAGYMSAPDILGGKAEEIATKLQTQLAMIQKHPWVKHTPVAASAPATVITDHIITAPSFDEPTPAPHTQVDAATIDAAARGKLLSAPQVPPAMRV